MCVFVVAEAVMMAKVLFIIYNQKSVVRLLTDLQEMANESKILVATVKKNLRIIIQNCFVL